MKVLITGGSGFIGRHLCSGLIALEHQVSVLTRDTSRASGVLGNRVGLFNSFAALDSAGGFDVIVNITGESLNGRWTRRKKQKIYHSRLQTTARLVEYIERAQVKPSLLISGSAIGYYGASESTEFAEDSQPADEGFAHDLCRRWEETAAGVEACGVRLVCLRTGIVLGDGGALAQMLTPFKCGLGGRMGSGRQWMSWIHIDDLTGIVLHIINNKSITGALNATAPEPVTNAEFTSTLASVLNRPALLTMPAFSLKLLFGEMAEELLLKGQKVLPQKALDNGYSFRYPLLADALSGILDTD